MTWIKAAGRAAFDCEAAMKVSEVMTPSVSVASPDETVERAAATMSNANVGILPVTKGTRLVGIVTDRDIVVRTVAKGSSARRVLVGDVMTEEVHFCLEDDDVDDITRRMGETRVRRMPVLDRNDRIVGIVSLDDIAACLQWEHAVIDALRKIKSGVAAGAA